MGSSYRFRLNVINSRAVSSDTVTPSLVLFPIPLALQGQQGRCTPRSLKSHELWVKKVGFAFSPFHYPLLFLNDLLGFTRRRKTPEKIWCDCESQNLWILLPTFVERHDSLPYQERT